MTGRNCYGRCTDRTLTSASAIWRSSKQPATIIAMLTTKRTSSKPLNGNNQRIIVRLHLYNSWQRSIGATPARKDQDCTCVALPSKGETLAAKSKGTLAAKRPLASQPQLPGRRFPFYELKRRLTTETRAARGSRSHMR